MKWRSVQSYGMTLRNILLLGVGLTGLFAVLVFSGKIPLAHASSCPGDFICPGGYGGPGGDGNWDGGVKLTDSLAGNNGTGPPTGIPSGTTMNFTASYTIDNAVLASDHAFLWVIINTNTGAQNVQLSSVSPTASGGSLPVLVNDVCGGSNAALPNQFCNTNPPQPPGNNNNENQCPSFYYGSEGHYQAGDPAYAGKPYIDGSTPDEGSEVTCNGSGNSIIWPWTANKPAGTTVSANFSVTIPVTYLHDMNVSVRAYVSLSDQTAALANVWTRSDLQNYAVYPVSFKGVVTSDPVNATGRGIPGIQLTISDCNGNNVETTTTDGNGNYSFNYPAATAYQTVCIVATSAAGDGSQYGPDPPGSTTSCNRPDLFCTQNFVLSPVAQPSAPSKTSNPASGTAVVPGQAMTFSINTKNPYDDNINVDTVHGEQMDDEIPLNINPSTISGVTASVTSVPGGPGSWSVNASIPCTGVSNPFNYGYGGTGYTANAACGYTAPSASGGTPGYVWVNLSTMPAYSQITLNWGGSVYSAGSVGVYPTNAAYCANGAATYFGLASSVLQNCSDFNVGEQGVSNFAYDFIAADMSPTYSSNDTYNPIPGDLKCIGKDTTAQTQLGYPLVNSGVCGTQIPAPGDRWVYSTDSPEYSSAQFTIHVKPDNTAGPVYYYITDQDPGPANATSTTNNILQSGKALDPALQNVSSLSMNGYDTANILHWDNINSANTTAGGPGSFQNQNFQVQFSNVSNGYTATNTAKACYPLYWNAPSAPGNYATNCISSNTTSLTQEAIAGPYVTTANGDIHLGGSASNTGSCTVPAIIQGDQNPGANGQYFVSTSGPLPSASIFKQPFFNSSATGGATSGTSYGPVCRPDIVTSTNNYAGETGNSVTYSPSIWTNQAPLNGKVVVANGNVTIPANTVISSRWTLIVHNGNIYIPGNVTLAPTVYNGQPEAVDASFGVVVDNGNIYIDPQVTSLSGFYFASPNSTGGNGLINTCAGSLTGLPTLAVSGAYTVGQCSNQLTVNGLMMAYGFQFSRTTAPTTGPAENVQFDDRLYTATPPGFSDLGAGYLPPLYLPETNSRY